MLQIKRVDYFTSMKERQSKIRQILPSLVLGVLIIFSNCKTTEQIPQDIISENLSTKLNQDDLILVTTKDGNKNWLTVVSIEHTYLMGKGYFEGNFETRKVQYSRIENISVRRIDPVKTVLVIVVPLAVGIGLGIIVSNSDIGY